MDRIAHEGITYNAFHTTAMCSPTRASLLTGRNHHYVGNGQIAELANDWDGYSGVIPKTCATVAEVLKDYGYHTGAWGKWHNTSAQNATAAGPFDYWPTGYGFEYFYGSLAGEASQYEPCLVRNTAFVEHPNTSGGHDYYHLREDLADDAILWLQQHKAFSPDKPFFMYWASGASHGPHQVPKEWADTRPLGCAYRQNAATAHDLEVLPGKQKIEVVTKYIEKKAAGPLDVTLKVNGKEVAKGRVPVSAPLGFTANDCLDIGTDLGSPVSLDYFDLAPFKFDGTIDVVHVKYIE